MGLGLTAVAAAPFAGAAVAALLDLVLKKALQVRIVVHGGASQPARLKLAHIRGRQPSPSPIVFHLQAARNSRNCKELKKLLEWCQEPLKRINKLCENTNKQTPGMPTSAQPRPGSRQAAACSCLCGEKP